MIVTTFVSFFIIKALGLCMVFVSKYYLGILMNLYLFPLRVSIFHKEHTEICSLCGHYKNSTLYFAFQIRKKRYKFFTVPYTLHV